MRSLSAAAPTYSVLNSFNYSQGGRPNGLTPGDGTLFGTTSAGGTSFGGEIFTVNQDGSGFTVLKYLAVSNGIMPFGDLLLYGGRLYGTATQGGAYTDPENAPSGYGAIFCLDLNGSNFMVLHSFDSTNGASPFAGLFENAGTLYGTTLTGGSNGFGTIFKMSTNGADFTVLKTFSREVAGTNSDGAQPYGGLVGCGKTLYGTTTYGGAYGSGVVFKLDTNGSNFTVLKSFSATANYINSDGAYPHASLLCAHGMLYGTTSLGGAYGNGTVFKLKNDGSGFAVLKTFSSLDEDTGMNDDGALPYSGLMLNGNTLYGTTYEGGTNGYGTVFKVNTIGAGFSAIKHFSGDDGSNPHAGLVMVGGTLFGTATTGGGSNDDGALFGLALPPFPENPSPAVTIQASGNLLKLAWDAVPGNNYQVQFTTNLARFNEWTNLRGLLQASGSTLSSFDIIQTNATRSYRVVVVP